MHLITSPMLIPVVAIVGVFTWLIVSAMANAARQIVKHRNEVELKHAMIQRGMSADEIERVLSVSSDTLD